jgi:hypothetical protein
MRHRHERHGELIPAQPDSAQYPPNTESILIFSDDAYHRLYFLLKLRTMPTRKPNKFASGI